MEKPQAKAAGAEVSGVSLSQMGLVAVGSRCCADGEPHELVQAALNQAVKQGSAESPCRRCGETVRLERAVGELFEGA